jgi:hypothetical protein
MECCNNVRVWRSLSEQTETIVNSLVSGGGAVEAALSVYLELLNSRSKLYYTNPFC